MYSEKRRRTILRRKERQNVDEILFGVRFKCVIVTAGQAYAALGQGLGYAISAHGAYTPKIVVRAASIHCIIATPTLSPGIFCASHEKKGRKKS